MINTTLSSSLKRKGGFILITTLVFLTVVSLLTLSTIQLATQDLLLVGNMRQRFLAEHALLNELDRRRAQLDTTSFMDAQMLPSHEQTTNFFSLGCYVSPWVPVEGPQATPPFSSYELYKTIVAANGPASSSSKAIAIVARRHQALTCQAG